MPSPDARPERRHLGGDFYLTETDGGLRVDLGFQHPEWRPRRAGDVTRPTFPGSAVLSGERWYEVVRVGFSPDSPPRHLYVLEPWDDSFPIRKAYELTADACAKVSREHWQKKRREATGEILGYFPFVLGMLPADVQHDIERHYGLPAGRNTVISAVLLLMISVFVGVLTLAKVAGHDLGAFRGFMNFVAPFKAIFVYLAVESFFRLPTGMRGEGAGSLPVAGPVVAIRTLARSLTREERQRATTRRRAKAGAYFMANARDEVRRLADGGLEVLSRLPKKHWTAHATGIYYRGEAYVLTEREIVGTGDDLRHRFLLQKPEGEVLFKSVAEYRPEEVRDVWRAGRRLEAAMWVETMRPLWGLLDQETQLRLGRTYRYDPWKYTRWSIQGAGFVGVLGFAGAILSMAIGSATGADAFWLFAGIVLVWEALLRWRSYQQGEIRGSLLGLALKPLARKALQWE